ncbi:hypothetical protein Tco_0444435 [Tanacetum coccineum]
MKKLIRRSKKSFYGSSKPVVYGYDVVSYSLNFDDGNPSDEYYLYGSRCSQALDEDRRRRKWKKLMKKVVEESKKSIYGTSTKALVFRYDAISYSHNFDDGNYRDECYLYGL